MSKMTTPAVPPDESRRVTPSEESRRATPSSDYDLLIYLVTHPSITEEEARRELGIPLKGSTVPSVPLPSRDEGRATSRQRGTSLASYRGN